MKTAMAKRSSPADTACLPLVLRLRPALDLSEEQFFALCQLNRDLRIVSRITHERNLEAIHRAGTDFVLSYTTLGIEAVMSVLRGHPPVLLGEGVELFIVPVPPSLAGRPLSDSGIGSRTGLSVVALQQGDRLTAPLTSETVLPAGAHLLMLGSHEQRGTFDEAFGRAR